MRESETAAPNNDMQRTALRAAADAERQTDRERSMAGASWIQYVTAFGAVATPILVAVLTIIGWRLRNRLERQAQLRSDRVGIYNEICQGRSKIRPVRRRENRPVLR